MSIIVKRDGVEEEFDEIKFLRQQPNNLLEVKGGEKKIYLLENFASNIQFDFLGDGASTIKIYFFTTYKKDLEGNYTIYNAKLAENKEDETEEFSNNENVLFNILKITGFYFETDADLEVNVL